MGTIQIDRKNTLMVAHRGLSGLEKENTAAAFVAAGNRSYYGIETDVHRTRDGQFVVIHDGDTTRVAGETHLVGECTLEELQSIRLKDRRTALPRADLRIPTLAEYLSICKGYGKKCVLELKDLFSREELERIIGEIEAQEYLPEVIFISFHPQNMKLVREILPEQPAQQLCNDLTEETFDLIKTYRLNLDMQHIYVTQQIVDRVHAEGLLINCWTVNDPQAAEALIEMGVDFITTNILE